MNEETRYSVPWADCPQCGGSVYATHQPERSERPPRITLHCEECASGYISTGQRYVVATDE